LATRFDVPKAGKVTLRFDADAKDVWLDGKPAAAGKELVLELAAGTHTLVVRADVAALPALWVVQSGDVVFRPE
jgi:hypothetical protein